ncbi:hypothetical protein KAH27_08845 [bacterium]|nr:hypothetical protein [bacterium]
MWISNFYHDCKRVFITMPGNPVIKFIKLWFVPSVHIMFVHRIGSGIVKLWPPFSWILLIPYAVLQFIIRVIYVAIIPARTKIGPGCVILHSYGVHLHPLAKLGNNVTIAEQVGVGAAKLSDTKYPVIGDEVMLGIGSKILGPITINHHAVVGANAVVLKDMPAYAVIGGIPAKVLKINRPNKRKRENRYRPYRRNRNAHIKTDKRSGAIHINEK